jgi:hypothetical protein
MQQNSLKTSRSPVLRMGQQARIIAHHVIIHGTETLVTTLARHGLSFKSFVG